MNVVRRLAGFSFMDANRVLMGIASLVIGGAVVIGVFTVATLGLFERRYEMSGVFADSAGLRKGDLVRMAGVDVGTVTGVNPDFEQGHVVVTWKVDDGVELGPQTTAEISLATLLGGKFLRLAGPVEPPFMSSLPAERRRIPLERTTVPASVQEVLDNASRAVQALEVDDLNLLVNELADVTLDTGDEAGALLADLATVSAAVNQRQAEVTELVANADAVTAALAAKDQVLVQLVDHANVLLEEIGARRDELATLLGSGSEVVTTLSDLLVAHRADLDAIIGDLHATLEVTHNRLPELNSTLAFVGPTFDAFSTISQQGPWLDSVSYGIGPVDLVSLVELVLGGG